MTDTSTRKTTYPLRNNCTYIIFFAIAYSIASIYLLSQLFKISPLELFTAFKEILYVPRESLCSIIPINDFHIYNYFYYVISIMTLITILVIFIIGRITKKINTALLKKIVCIIIFINFVFLVLIQQINRNSVWIRDIKITHNKTEHEKYQMLYNDLYDSAIKTKAALKGRHQADFLTDMDCSVDPCLFDKNLIAYFAYPELSINIDNGAPKDCKILFYKNDPLNYIEKDEEILLNMSYKYILTIKK